jgi:hypothetical protein
MSKDTLIPYTKGKSGNPGGKAVGTRNRLQGSFWRALAEDFDEHGVQAIRDARESDPMGYIKTVASLMPRQFEQTSPLNELTDAELNAGIDYLRSKLSIASLGTGAGETKLPQSSRELQAIPEANRIPRSGVGLPGTALDGGKPVGQDPRGGHGNSHASDRGVS